MRTALTRALSIDDINQLGRETGQSERLRTITPDRLFLSMMAALAARQVESLADLLREFKRGLAESFGIFRDLPGQSGL
jgi:hypothetical protein